MRVVKSRHVRFLLLWSIQRSNPDACGSTRWVMSPCSFLFCGWEMAGIGGTSKSCSIESVSISDSNTKAFRHCLPLSQPDRGRHSHGATWNLSNSDSTGDPLTMKSQCSSSRHCWVFTRIQDMDMSSIAKQLLMAALNTATVAIASWEISNALCHAWHFSQLLSAVANEKAYSSAAAGKSQHLEGWLNVIFRLHVWISRHHRTKLCNLPRPCCACLFTYWSVHTRHGA